MEFIAKKCLLAPETIESMKIAVRVREVVCLDGSRFELTVMRK